MPRTGRVVLPRYPHHITQRGHDKGVVFVVDQDYQYYLDTLAEYKKVYGVSVYAWCLMTNHVHLLLAPSDFSGLSQLMKRLAGRQTRYRNSKEGRTGTLWESRYKSSLVDEQAYLLACIRYIELNPVRAGMVARPEEHIWSSYRARVGLGSCSWLDPVPGLESIKRDEETMAESYAQYVRSAIPDGEWDLIQTAASRNQLTGDERFVEQITRITGRRIEHRGRGRPTGKTGK